MPFIEENYDFVIFDTQGAVGPVQDAVALASSFLLTPIKPDVLSAREYISGTEDSLKRLLSGSNPMMNIKVPPLKAIIYAQDRTQDASMITESLKDYFNRYIDGTQTLLNTIIPSQVSFKTAATKQVPVHCFERVHPGKSKSGLQVMLDLVYELFPVLREQQAEPRFFDEMQNLLPVEGERS